MPLNAQTLGDLIKTNVEGVIGYPITDEQGKAVMTAIASAVVTHLQEEAEIYTVVTVSTSAGPGTGTGVGTII